jgi:alpha-galactosidase
MNRRHFIRASGFSVASFLMSESLFARSRSAKGQLMRMPDEVTAILNDMRVHLHPLGDSRWTYKEFVVSVRERENSISVEIEAPKMRVSEVTLQWKTEGKATSSILNDHLERTYGDVSWHAPHASEMLPWYFMEYNNGSTHGFGVKTGTGSICFWEIREGMLSLTLDTRSGGNGVLLGSRTLLAAEVVIATSYPGETPFQTTRRFVGTLCDQDRTPAQPVYGINDWYFTYGNNSAKLILEHTKLMAPMAEGLSNRPFSVIDAGWFQAPPASPNDCCWGDTMGASNDRFGDMEKLAEKIRQIGMRPGIWTRPLCGGHRDSPALMLPLIKGREELRPVLDPSIPENLERIRQYFKLYNQWGYGLVKFDFTTFDIFGKWGFEMLRDRTISTANWSMNDTSRTNAEIVLGLYQTIREAAGDTYLIGCNTFSHLSAGLFELNRIGDDTSGNEWDRTRKMGVNTLAFRGLHHGVFYAADADCVGLTTRVPWEKNKQWMELVAHSGTPLFISAQPEATGPEQKRAIRESFQTAARNTPLGEPLDWMERPVPKKWKLDGRLASFDWD